MQVDYLSNSRNANYAQLRTPKSTVILEEWTDILFHEQRNLILRILTDICLDAST